VQGTELSQKPVRRGRASPQGRVPPSFSDNAGRGPFYRGALTWARGPAFFGPFRGARMPSREGRAPFRVKPVFARPWAKPGRFAGLPKWRRSFWPVLSPVPRLVARTGKPGGFLTCPGGILRIRGKPGGRTLPKNIEQDVFGALGHPCRAGWGEAGLCPLAEHHPNRQASRGSWPTGTLRPESF